MDYIYNISYLWGKKNSPIYKCFSDCGFKIYVTKSEPTTLTASEVIQPLIEDIKEDINSLKDVITSFSSSRLKAKVCNLINEIDNNIIDLMIGDLQNDQDTFSPNDNCINSLSDKSTNIFMTINNIDISNPKYIVEFNTYFHFYRLILLLRPSWFIIKATNQYFSTKEGEVLMKLFEPYKYNTQLIRLNEFLVTPSDDTALLIGNSSLLSLNLDKLHNDMTTVIKEHDDNPASIVTTALYDFLAKSIKLGLDSTNRP